ncbi:hypothetical protein BH11PLA2_BH11PLA2_15070 [soil metagenome]
MSGTIATPNPTSPPNTATITTQTSRVLTVNQTTDGTFPGVIAGAGTFTLGILSTNTLTLTGANTHTGGTVITAGTLAANTLSPDSATGTAAVTVTGGTLRGTGNISGAITLNGGKTAPGDANNSGVLTTTSMLVASPLTGSMSFNVSGGAVDSSQLFINVAGNLDLGTAMTLTVTPYLGNSNPDHFTLIKTLSGTGVSGAFNNFAEGAVVFANTTTGRDYVINYGTFSSEPGNVVLSIVPIPEPTVLGLVVAAGFGMLIRRRRAITF